jgi:hypothetical protein
MGFVSGGEAQIAIERIGEQGHVTAGRGGSETAPSCSVAALQAREASRCRSSVRRQPSPRALRRNRAVMK